jgi:predicted amidophosphoribosyltransferase
MKIKGQDGEWRELPKLKPCPDCGKEVSVNAVSCPHCGRKLKQEQTATGLLAAIIIALIIGGLLFGLPRCS